MLKQTRRSSRRLFVALLVVVLAVTVLAAPSLSVLASGQAQAGAPAELAAGLSWQLVHQAPTGQYYYGITFPTRDVGYAVSGPDWNNASSGSGAPTYISKTTDGGKTWKSNPIANSDGWMRGITCTDANNCWIAGKVKGRILRTTNGGTTWGNISNVSSYPNWLWSAGFTGKGTTILAGTTCYDPNDPYAKANWLRSTDGQTFGGVQAVPGKYMCAVQWDIECPAAGYCYSAGKDYVWRSTNDGQTWAQLSPARVRWYGLSCTSTSNCWVSGKSPHIMSTSNSGGTWAQAAIAGMPTGGQFWDISMVSKTVGYAVGCDSVATDNSDRCLGKGVIAKTTDGVLWATIPSPTTADIMDIWTFGENSVYVIDWSGKIWYGSTEPTPTPTPTNTATPTATATPNAGTIGGFVFEDANDDAFRDGDEKGVENAVMVLRRGGQEIATAVSNSDGMFRFADVAPGQYTLRQKQAPEGYKRSLFLVAFELTANREFTFYAAHAPKSDDTPTPTVTVTVTATETSIPTETPTASPTPTATPEPTATPTVRSSMLGWLPILLR